MPTEVTTSATSPFHKLRAIVLGPPGHAKSPSCITLSEKCPEDWTHLRLTTLPIRPMVECDDLLYVCFDNQATMGFKQLGVSVPTLDLSLVEPGKLTAELRLMGRMIAERVKTGKTTTVIVDTVSSLDTALYHAARREGKEKYDLYGFMKDRHVDFHSDMKALDANVVFLCHAKVGPETEAAASATESTKKMAENASDKSDAWGTGEIVPEITGAGLNLYRKDASFIFSVSKSKQLVSGKLQDGFWFHTQHEKFDTKSRLILPTILPADWRAVRKYL